MINKFLVLLFLISPLSAQTILYRKATLDDYKSLYKFSKKFVPKENISNNTIFLALDGKKIIGYVSLYVILEAQEYITLVAKIKKSRRQFAHSYDLNTINIDDFEENLLPIKHKSLTLLKFRPNDVSIYFRYGKLAQEYNKEEVVTDMISEAYRYVFEHIKCSHLEKIYLFYKQEPNIILDDILVRTFAQFMKAIIHCKKIDPTIDFLLHQFIFSHDRNILIGDLSSPKKHI